MGVYPKCDSSVRSTIFSILLSLVSVTLILSSVSTWRGKYQPACTRVLSGYSPLLHAVQYEKKFSTNGFYETSMLRGRPNPARELAWSEHWESGYVGLSDDELTLLNKPLDKDWVRVPEAAGAGAMAAIEAFHQLHCLSMIRQYTYRGVYDYSADHFWQQSPDYIRDHVDHCIETIRINLMCIADATPYLLVGEDNVDFSSVRMCRKHEPLAVWMEENEDVHLRARRDARSPSRSLTVRLLMGM